jgi:hypothetical protein
VIIGFETLMTAILGNPTETLTHRLSLISLKPDDLLRVITELPVKGDGAQDSADAGEDARGDDEAETEDQTEAEAEAETEAEARATGFNLRFQREPETELALDHESFAFSLARLFRLAEGEFSLALLGRWGSGKTTVAMRVKTLLTKPELYTEAHKAAFSDVGALEELIADDYAVITFNAWRYRRRPELWIWLYESFVAEYLKANAPIRVLRTLRAGLTKHGLIPTGFTLVLLALIFQPFLWLALVLPYGITLFGVGGVLALVFLARRAQGSLRQLLDRYGVVTSHREHLGMQALVGEDLKTLVLAWTKAQRFEPKEQMALAAMVGVVAVGWIYSLFHEFQDSSADLLKLVAAALSLKAPAGAEFSLPVTAVAFGVWALIAALCQCRSKIPQKCRSNFPHFRDLVTSQIRGLS